MRFLCPALAGCLFATVAAAAVRIPAFTAYVEPNPEGAWVNEPAGVTHWDSPTNRIAWFGQFKESGPVDATVALRIPSGKILRYALTLGAQRRELKVAGRGDSPVNADFGTFSVAHPGYHEFALACLESAGPCGDVEALLLEGASAVSAKFNLKERRNAASVHWMYPVPAGTNVAVFFAEATGVTDPLWTYYMACGWHRGYLGMQVNGPQERRIIFSVWDSGNEGVDRSKVGSADRVKLVRKGPGVIAGDFGNEGTGGHSHLVYSWKTGTVIQFAVTAEPTDATHTTYSGFYRDSWAGKWKLVSAWNAPKEGGYMHGLYSFSENFGGANGHLRRKALFGNQWIRTDKDQWIELTRARFSCDPTGKADRFDRFGGVEDGRFFLSQGGFLDDFTDYGKEFARPPTGKPPVLDLP
jgi:Domain of unknown function (DUF3472)/Domain of unknown function (DUF5077)